MKKLLLFVMIVTMLVASAFSFKAIMVTDTGGLGDKSFNDGTWSGVLRAKNELKIEAEVIVSKEQTDYIPNLTDAAKRSDVVLAVGFLMADALAKIAPQFPDKKFIGIDIVIDPIPSNVALYNFKEQESAFLVGYIAGSVNKTGKVGFLGGIKVPAVARFEIGYRAGIAAYNQLKGKNTEVLIAYANHFGDAPKGKSLSLAQMEQGADIVFAPAGATGNGAFEAAKEKALALYALKDGASLDAIKNAYKKAGKGYFAIGVDIDQDYLAPGIILASAMKGIDVAAFDGIKSAMGRKFASGNNVVGLKENGVRLSALTYTKDMIDPVALKEIEKIIEDIKSGKLVIPEDEVGLKNFKVN